MSVRDLLKMTTKHTVVFGIGDIAQKAISFLLLPVYMRCLSPDDYGVLALLSILAMAFSNVILQGLPTAAFRAYSYDYGNDEEQKKDAIYTAYNYLVLFSFVFYGILFLSAHFWSDLLFKQGNFTRFVQLVFLTEFFNCSTNIPFVILRARLLSLWVAGISLTRVFFGAVLTIWLVVFLEKGVYGVLLANLIISFLMFCCSPIIPLIIHKSYSFRISLKKLKPMLFFGLPIVPGIFAAWIMSSADRYFLEHFSTRAELGLYSIGFSFATVLSFVMIEPFRKTWPAVFYPKARDGDAQHVFSRFATYFLLACYCAGLVIILFSDPLLRIMGPKEYWNASAVIPILVIGVLVHGFQGTINIGLFIKNKTKYAPLIVIAGAVMNIILNAALVPPFGMIGAAVGTLLSFFIMLIITYLINQRIYPIPFEYKRIAHMTLIFFIFVIMNQISGSESIWVTLSYKTLLFSVFIVSLFVSNFFIEQELSVMRGYLKKFSLLVSTRN